MTKIFKKAIVQKRNVLNEIRSNNMTLQELRFFSIYLSKINPLDISTRVVCFPVEDFQRIMDFGRINIGQLQASTDSLLCKIVHIPDENGRGMRSFQLFKECHIFRNDNNKWFVEIDAHDKSLPLMFDFRSRYFNYELWNTLRLKSSNQVRMYEILKQYEKVGKRELTITELRSLIGIADNEYPRWDRFRDRVLDSCQKALSENTDISFTYERGEVGTGGKWLTIIFHISKNKDYKDPLCLDKFIETKPFIEANLDDEYEEKEIEYGGELANLLGTSACNDEFTVEEIRVIQDLVLQVKGHNHKECCDYLIEQVHKMNLYESREKIKNRFAYLCKIIEKDIKNIK